MSAYKLSFEAEDDIFNIVVSSAKMWGSKQAVKYSEMLEGGMEALAKQEVPYKTLNDFGPPILIKKCGHHYIFGQEVDDDFVIIAVLHERMDLLTRLKHRLA